MTWAIPLASLAIAGFSIVAGAIFASRTAQRAASSEYVTQLEHRVEECEKDRGLLRQELQALTREVNKLRDRELDLMRRLLRLENGQ